MKTKHKLIIISAASIFVTAGLLVGLAFAWVSLASNVDSITLVAGRAEAKVNGFMFKRQSSGLSTYVNTTPDKIAQQLPSSSNELIFTFADTTGTLFGDFDFEDLYYDQNSLNASAIPSYYVELQVSTAVEQSYVRIALWLEAYGSGETEPDFMDFGYRYRIVNNDSANPISYATPGSVSPLSSAALHSIEDDFNPSTGIRLNDGINNYLSISIPPAQAGFYDNHFAKSAVIEITPDPLALSWFLKETNGLVNSEQTLGCRLAFSFEFSLTPFGA